MTATTSTPRAQPGLPGPADGTVHDLYLDCREVLGRIPCPGPVDEDAGRPAHQELVIPDDSSELVRGLSSYGC